MAKRSYLGAALATGPNRNAAIATLAIAVGVLSLAQIPVAPGSEVDLRAPNYLEGWTQASLFGFGISTPKGRGIETAPGRILWNRPLPERFTLGLDIGVAAPNTRIRISVGDQREVIGVPRNGPASIEIHNPLGLREIRLATVPPRAHFQLRRAMVR
ncbi:MAG: hypothetical protein VX246_05350 [Myxococcota bacterium]|nr:hypothetical protein [Myxococcota bacterium]